MKLCKRVFIYCLGLFFLATGVTFSIKSQLGISPVNSIPYVVSLITGIEQGHVIIVVFASFILLQIILLRNRFEKKNLFQIVFSVIFGYFVTFTNTIFTFDVPTNYVIKVILLIISMVFIAIGIMLFLRANIMPMPAEGCVLAIGAVTNKEFHKIKSIFDTILVVSSVALSLIIFKDLIGVREGTIIASVFTGKIMGWLEKVFKTQIQSLEKFVAS